MADRLSFQAMVPMPRNPARMPAGVEQAAADMTINPLWELAQGVGATASGAWNSPEAGAGMMAGLGMMSPASRLARPGIRAFHGSPHSFDRFNISKIGTGEGAQAYGHGLYFAGNETVAKRYRDTLSAMQADPTKANETFALLSDLLVQKGHNPRLVRGAIGDLKAEFSSGGRLSKIDESGFFPELQPIIRDAREMGGKTIDNMLPQGNMYEVNIAANPNKLLDWDKTLASQPAVNDVAQPILQSVISPRKAGSSQDVIRGQGLPPDKMTGADAHRILTRGMGGQEAAAKALNEAGVPGIKYLDGVSRGVGDGSSNYVVFDDRYIDILRKYGLAGMLGGAGAYGAANPSAPPAMVGGGT